MSVLQTYGPGRRRILTPYVLIWVGIAVVATGYLSLLAVRPELFETSGIPNLSQQLAETKRDMSRAVADLDPLRRSVGEIKLEVANLKFATNETMARQSNLNDRVSALEAAAPKVARIGEATTDSAPAPQGAPPAPTRDPRKAAAKPAKPAAPPHPAVVAPLPGHQKSATVINGPAKKAASAEPSETGSILGPGPAVSAKHAPKTQVAAQTKAAAHPKPAPVGVLLATGPSVDALRLNWTILNDRHGDAVKSLAPRYVVSGPANKRVYSLVAGPVASAEQAKTLCQTMAQKGQACEVSTYRGSSL